MSRLKIKSLVTIQYFNLMTAVSERAKIWPAYACTYGMYIKAEFKQACNAVQVGYRSNV